mmetsp:Transcript_29437/g.87004  ORF Transcript_29437/g.87004 Transcript_29437/m.87004 type:complete len:315 (-) Transcript_29437:438-1382(-)
MSSLIMSATLFGRLPRSVACSSCDWRDSRWRTASADAGCERSSAYFPAGEHRFMLWLWMLSLYSCLSPPSSAPPPLPLPLPLPPFFSSLPFFFLSTVPPPAPAPAAAKAPSVAMKRLGRNGLGLLLSRPSSAEPVGGVSAMSMLQLATSTCSGHGGSSRPLPLSRPPPCVWASRDASSIRTDIESSAWSTCRRPAKPSGLPLTLSSTGPCSNWSPISRCRGTRADLERDSWRPPPALLPLPRPPVYDSCGEASHSERSILPAGRASRSHALVYRPHPMSSAVRRPSISTSSPSTIAEPEPRLLYDRSTLRHVPC